MNAPPGDTVEVIARVAELVRRVEARDAVATSAAISSMVELVEARAPQLLVKARESLAAAREETRIDPLDPELLEWDPFALFGAQEKEPAWTQWLAACLRTQHGTALAGLVWRALCESVVTADHHPDEGDEIATVDDWREASECAPRDVLDEFRASEGRPDVVIHTERFVLVLENKLWADWHDRIGRPQASSYELLGRRLGQEHALRVALVLLTCRAEMQAPVPWVVITYAQLARQLRLQLKRELALDGSAATIAKLIPALTTVRAIEQHLLPTAAAPRARNDDPVGELLARLRHQRAAEGLG